MAACVHAAAGWLLLPTWAGSLWESPHVFYILEKRKRIYVLIIKVMTPPHIIYKKLAENESKIIKHLTENIGVL